MEMLLIMLDKIQKLVWQQWVKAKGRRAIWLFLLAILVFSSIVVQKFFPNLLQTLTKQEKVFLLVTMILLLMIIGLTLSVLSYRHELNNRPIKFLKLLWDKNGNPICEKCGSQLIVTEIDSICNIISISDPLFYPKLKCQICDKEFIITNSNGIKIHPSIAILKFKKFYK